jgi:hypothetical protein
MNTTPKKISVSIRNITVSFEIVSWSYDIAEDNIRTITIITSDGPSALVFVGIIAEDMYEIFKGAYEELETTDPREDNNSISVFSESSFEA